MTPPENEGLLTIGTPKICAPRIGTHKVGTSKIGTSENRDPKNRTPENRDLVVHLTTEGPLIYTCNLAGASVAVSGATIGQLKHMLNRLQLPDA